MTGDSIFPVLSLNPSRIRWEDQLHYLTPVEERAPGRLYKREDYFAPLGYGGINGAKLRQCIALIHAAVSSGAADGIITAASVLSPQVSMAALVARHYSVPCTVMLGATTPESSLRHENVAIAAEAGADFLYNSVGYNPALQAAVEKAHADEYPSRYRLSYGITTPSDASDAAVAEFHGLGAGQVKNVPGGVGTLVMTAGSCNSCVSVLYGIAKYRPKGLERVVLLGVGPTRLDWIENRLVAIERATGVDIAGLFRRRYIHHLDDEGWYQTDGELVLEHWDLHSTGFATYQDRMPYSLDGVDFHPTYEGKALAYMAANPRTFDWFWNPGAADVLFWIVGSSPSRRAMQDALLLDGIGSYA